MTIEGSHKNVVIEPREIVEDAIPVPTTSSNELETLPDVCRYNAAPQHLQALVPEGARASEDHDELENDEDEELVPENVRASEDHDGAVESKETLEEDSRVSEHEDVNETGELQVTEPVEAAVVTEDVTTRKEDENKKEVNSTRCIDDNFVQRYVEEIIRKSALVVAEQNLQQQQQQQQELDTESVGNVSHHLFHFSRCLIFHIS